MSFFKNILIYRFEEPFSLSYDDLEGVLADKPLTSCLSQEMESYGWLSAFPDGKNYVEQINHTYFIRLGVEQKIMPKSAVKTAVEKKAEALDIKIEGKQHYKELEETVLNELMPLALTQRSAIQGYIDLEKNWLVLDASSVKKASILTSYLRKTLGTLSIVNFSPESSLQTILTNWVTHGIASTQFELLEDVELREPKDEGGVARIKGVPLDAIEIRQHLEGNWQVMRVSLCYNDAISFSLSNDFILKRLRFLDTFHEELDSEDEPLLRRQAEAILSVASFRNMIDHLYSLCHE